VHRGILAGGGFEGHRAAGRNQSANPIAAPLALDHFHVARIGMSAGRSRHDNGGGR
jgi:hypothetical protein